MPEGLYERDILAWSEHESDLLRRVAGGERVNDVDWPHVIEEIAEVGISQLNAVHGLLTQAILHLWKIHLLPDSDARIHWHLEPAAFIGSASRRFAPSMRQRIDVAAIWSRALGSLPREIKDRPAFSSLPAACPLSLDDLLGLDQDSLLDRLRNVPVKDERQAPTG